MRIKQNLYTLETLKYDKEIGWHYITLDNHRLFANMTYPTKLTPDDLPEWFIYGRYYKRFGYLNCKGVKHMMYIPCFMNHMFKDDCLLISYDEPIIKTEENMHGYDGAFSYKADAYVFGSDIIHVLKAAEKFSNYDISNIKHQIDKKRLWLKSNEEDAYRREVSDDGQCWWD